MTTNRGKKYSYYGCVANRAERVSKGSASRILPHRAPHVSAPWLEDLVWQDVKRFLENPGEILKRVREQLKDESDTTQELEARREDQAKRLAAKQSEKDRYVRLYVQEHISETELETYLTDLKNQIGNLRLLIEATEADLSQRRELTELADTTCAWLSTLRERVAEVEENISEAFEKRQRLIRLLLQGVMLENEDRQNKVHVTYRFDPPDDQEEGEGVVGGVQNSLLIELAHHRFNQEPQCGRVELFVGQKAGDLIVTHAPSCHGREACSGGVGKGAQEIVGIESEKIFVHMWLTLLYKSNLSPSELLRKVSYSGSTATSTPRQDSRFSIYSPSTEPKMCHLAGTPLLPIYVEY